jgi:hypothetical protein
MNPESPAAPSPESSELEWLELVRAQVRSLRFGVVQLVIHDGRVTQIERTEKTRLDSDRPRSARVT